MSDLIEETPTRRRVLAAGLFCVLAGLTGCNSEVSSMPPMKKSKKDVLGVDDGSANPTKKTSGGKARGPR